MTVFRLLDAQERHTIRLQEPKYALPMVGRQAELALVRQQVELALRGQGQVVGVTAEAGMGKSRLLAEAIRLAAGQGMAAYGGECQSYGTHTSYLVWHNIWRGFFGLDPAWPVGAQIDALGQQIAAINEALLPRLPLLGLALGLPIPDNELTASLDPKLRKASLEALLIDCVRARTRVTPLLLVLEDCHWIDPLSHDLLEAVARVAATMPALILLAYRPPQVQQLLALRVAQFTHFTEIVLTHLPDEEVAQLVSSKLAQLFEIETGAPPELVRQISARAQGNPFYVEELLNYLRDRGIDPQDSGAIAQIELPVSLHALILSRIDQLTENQKIVLKVASVIGRLFRAAMLWGVYQEFGGEKRVRDDLDALSSLELTPLDTPDPELAYLFKHVLTQEVTYDTLPFATRATLHDRIGQYIEGAYPEVLEQYTDLLAYHYDHSENLPKRRQYLLKAGAIAQDGYANTAAIDYLRRALPLLDRAERGAALLRLGQVHETIGQWSEAGERYQQALADADGERGLLAQCQIAVGELSRRQGQYAEAAGWYALAEAGARQIDDLATVAKALICAGTLASQQNDFAAALERYEASLAIRRALGDRLNEANVLNNLCIVAYNQDDLQQARALQEQSLAIRRELGNRWAIANSLNNLGAILTDMGELAQARAHLEEAILIQRAIGDPAALAVTLNSLANLERILGTHLAALPLYRESIALTMRVGDRWSATRTLEDIAMLEAEIGEPEQALRAAGAAAASREAMSTPMPPPDQARLDTGLAPARETLGAKADAAWEEGRRLSLEQILDLVMAA